MLAFLFLVVLCLKMAAATESLNDIATSIQSTVQTDTTAPKQANDENVKANKAFADQILQPSLTPHFVKRPKLRGGNNKPQQKSKPSSVSSITVPSDSEDRRDCVGAQCVDHRYSKHHGENETPYVLSGLAQRRDSATNILGLGSKELVTGFPTFGPDNWNHETTRLTQPDFNTNQTARLDTSGTALESGRVQKRSPSHVLSGETEFELSGTRDDSDVEMSSSWF